MNRGKKAQLAAINKTQDEAKLSAQLHRKLLSDCNRGNHEKSYFKFIMNLNRFKKGFTKTNPEKGLRSLPGALRNDRDPRIPGTIRVRGTYISSGYPRAGKFFALSGYVLTVGYALALVASYLFTNSYISPLGVCIVAAGLVHGCALAAEGVCHAESKWTRKSLKLFWGITGVWLIASIYYLLTA